MQQVRVSYCRGERGPERYYIYIGRMRGPMYINGLAATDELSVANGATREVRFLFARYHFVLIYKRPAHVCYVFLDRTHKQ